MPCSRFLIQLGNVCQCRDTGIASLGENFQPLRHQRPVEAGQRHHITDRTEGNNIKAVQQIWFCPVPVPSCITQFPVYRNRQQKGNTDSRQQFQVVTTGFIQPVWIDHGIGIRRCRFHRMMVDHQHIKPGGRCGCQWFIGRGPAINGNDHLRAFTLQPL